MSPLPATAAPNDLGPESVFLITGGARGITAEIALHFASDVRPHLIVVGKSPRPGTESHETAGVDDPQRLRAMLTAAMRSTATNVTPAEVERALQALIRDREIRRNLAAAEEAGAKVEYVELDVRNEHEFGALIDRIYSKHGRLDVVIHGAGIIEDKLIKDKTPDSFDRVVSTKVDSAFTLLRKLRPESLRTLVFMSSITATFGNRGQADYGAANGVLNAIATLADSRWTARVCALNWGPWDKTGMVSSDVKRQFAAAGIEVISIDAGTAAAVREIVTEQASDAIVVFGSGPWSRDASPEQLEITA
jgi:NAD(P)-dependent dehydrogenase (short-subunit alcohol dehydrogenase family)